MQWFIFIAMTILFIVTPYQRGLYFIEDFYSISIMMLALFIVIFLRLILYKEVQLIGKGYLILLLPLCYLLSLPFAESPAGAWDSLIRWTTYTAFFLMLYWSTLQLKIKKWMPLIFHITGMWIAVHMLLTDQGWVTFPNSFVVERFAGVFQYPNTFGMLMALFFLYSLTMLTKSAISYRLVALYSFPLVLYFISFILAYSRGMLLFLPIIWFIGLVLLPIKKQIEYMTFTIISTIIALIIFQSITMGESLNSGILIVMTLISTGLIVGGKYLLTNKIHHLPKVNKVANKKLAKFILPTTLIIIGLAGLLDLKNDGLLYKVLPEQLQDRVEGISLTTSTAKERYFFIEDSFQMSKESPTFGMGGEAWASAYKNYQQSPYSSNKIHNGYLEWLVDTGWVGLILFTAVFGYLLYTTLKTVFKEKDVSQPIAITLSLLTIFTHSFIDFNFSFGTVWLMTCWLLIMGLSFKDRSPAKMQKNKYMEKLPILTLSLFTILVAITLVLSFNFMQANQDYKQAKQTNSLTAKKELLENAVKKHSNKLTYTFELSDIYAIIAENYNDTEHHKKVYELIDKTTTLEPKNASTWLKAASLSQKLGDEEQTIHFYDEALKVDHYNTKLYEMVITSKVNFALENESNKMKYVISAIEDFEKMIQLDRDFLNKSLSEAHNSRKFHITDEIYYQASLAYFLDHKYENIIKIYEEQKDLVTNIKLQAVTVLSYEKLGQLAKAEELYNVDKTNELAIYVEKLKGEIE